MNLVPMFKAIAFNLLNDMGKLEVDLLSFHMNK